MANTSYLVAVVQQPNGTYTVGCGGCRKTLAQGVTSEAQASRIAGNHRCTGNGR